MSSQEFSKAFEYYRAKRYQEAYDIWSKMTDDRVALYNAAVILYSQRITVEDHWNITYDLFLDSAKLGRRDSAFYCGDLIERKLVEGTYDEAVIAYYTCKSDNTDAFNRIKALAEKNTLAQGILSDCYYWGRFTSIGIDREEALKWAKIAHENGERKYSSCILGNLEKDREKAFKFYLEAVNADNVDAFSELGDCYKTGKGTAKNYPEAIRWYKKAVEHNDQWAIFQLGYMYLFGLGCNKNKERAVQLFDSILNSKDAHPKCLFNLGELYYYGDGGGLPETKGMVGLEKNFDLAISLWKRASERGIVVASAELAKAYYFGNNIARDYDLAYKYAKLSENDYIGSYILGCCYYFGHGCKKDPSLAETCFRRSLQMGYHPADKFLLHGKALKPYSQWKIEVDGADWLGQAVSNIVSSLFSGGDD